MSKRYWKNVLKNKKFLIDKFKKKNWVKVTTKNTKASAEKSN